MSKYYFHVAGSQESHVDFSRFSSEFGSVADPETVQEIDGSNLPQPRSFEHVAPGSRAEGPVSVSCPLDLAHLDAILSTIPDSAYTLETCHVVNRPRTALDYLTERAEQRAKAKSRKPAPARAWAYLSPAERIEAVFDYAAAAPGSVAFSANFSAAKHRALLSSGDPARALSRSLNDAAKRIFGRKLEIVFTFEFTRVNERLHVHGAAILPALTDDMLKLFRQVLRKAGGTVTGLGSGRQCDVRDLYDAAGWHGYCRKEADRTVKVLGTGKITFISADLRREAEADHDSRRAQAKVKPATVAETDTETHRESSAPVRPSIYPRPAHDSQRPSMAVSRGHALPACLIEEVDALLDGL